VIIHVIQEGETIDSIADSYGISAERLMLENELKASDKLALGEALVIVYPGQTHTVQEGDTLGTIAEAYGVSVLQLLRNNPHLSDREFIFPGETIIINYIDNMTAPMTTNGYAYPFIDRNTLKKTLPYLTYLTIFTYTVTADGKIVDIDDRELLELAKSYGVAPIMMLRAEAKNQKEEINVTHQVLMNEDRQNQFIDSLIVILKEKGYYGVNITTPYILPSDRNLYVEFMTKLSTRIHEVGFKVFDTFSLSAFEIMMGTAYKRFEYATLGQIVDGVMLITYEWGTAVGFPTGIIAVDTIKNMLEFATELIPSEKIFMGLSSIGYLWQLPYEAGVSKGRSISYNYAVEIAAGVGAQILYDEVTQAAFYQYLSGEEYVVRFRDARSVDAFVKLIPEYSLYGLGVWNIMVYFPQQWMIINTQYEIQKVI